MTPYEQLASIVAEQKTEIAQLRATLIDVQRYGHTEMARLQAALQQIFDRDSQAGDGWCSMIARKALDASGENKR